MNRDTALFMYRIFIAMTQNIINTYQTWAREATEAYYLSEQNGSTDC